MPIACSTILYRVILRKSWFDPDDGSIQPDAFFRRPSDEDGLSVFIADLITEDGCMALFNSHSGLVSLHAGRLMDIGLTVIPDPTNPIKALIPNAPLESSGRAEDERLAGEIAKASRVINRKTKKLKPASS